ncbi:adenylate/guanylate cyclase domain-containing protein [Ruegeria sp. R14_0]|uniref:adenylate/guanylate cyclase domain-containing protein n=1 Tax=Ruegeria sp. R14_0 TaxID=2821100 RepID=UPI001AD9C4CA|nr:adenylate/guanylate cyclase domain-containing protein [Ruegeria sp. R14_0]MBO9447451.1 AAA family ATPase [Ruegeria sp. R14_0]
MELDVRTWLEGLGLGEYASAFAENFVDAQVLPHLTEQDIKDIGVTAVGHRRKLLSAIAKLGELSQETTESPRRRPEADKTPQHTSERRQVTVLFADICGFTNLSSSLDSEEVHEFLGAYFEIADGIIGDFGGTVDKHVGDSVMAVFGAPISHGNDAERAVLAALAIQDAMPGISEQVGRSLKAHIGIASGEVVASGVGPDRHYTVIGDSVNLAARLTDKAKAEEIYISDVVRQALSAMIATTEVGDLSVKGLSNPVSVYSVQGGQNSIEPQSARPFLGRMAEVQQFRIAMDVCKTANRGQVIQVRGDPGIGKSRLTDEYCRLAGENDFESHRSLILDFGVGQGQDPIRSLVSGLLKLSSEEGLQQRQAAAKTAISNGFVTPGNEVHLNDLLNLPQSPENQALYDAMDNLTRNSGKIGTVVELVLALSARDPMLIVFEDIHWADKLVLKQIAGLGNGVADAPAIIVLTSRIEGDPIDPAWRGSLAGTPFMTLDLGPLSEADAFGMAANFVDTTNQFVRSCVERAAGNPLFLEQLLTSAQEAGDVQVPGSVQSIVQARLDRLSAADKMAIQAASILGQRFTLPSLRHLIGNSDYDCGTLVGHQLIRERGEDFLFAHALVRDGVYSSLLRARRNELHLSAADWFAGKDLPLYAEHLELAGHEDAAQAYLRAAESLQSALRFETAQRLAERGIPLAQNSEVLFRLHCLLGELLRDLGEPEESIDAYQAALIRQSDDTEKCMALLGIAEGMRIVERIDEAMNLVDEAQPIAEESELMEVLMRLHHLRGNLLFPKGDIAGCEAGHQQSIRYAKRIGSTEGEAKGLGGLGDAAYVAGRMRTSHDMLSRCVEISRENGYGRTEVANAAQICHTKIYLLELKEAFEQARRTIDAAHRVGHDRAELNAAAAALFAAVELSDWSSVGEFCEHVMVLGEALGSVRFSQEGMAFKAVYLNAIGRHEEAIASIDQAIAGARELGMAFGGPRMLGHLIRINSDKGAQDQAISEAKEIISRGCVGHNQPFFYRDAIEVMVLRQDWQEVLRYAALLEAFSDQEPLPWSDFYVARARALASHSSQSSTSESTVVLKSIRHQAEGLGLVSSLPAIDQALNAG